MLNHNSTALSPLIMASSPALAAPPSICCATGFKHEGDPQGTVIDMAGWKTYIATPPASNTKKRVLIYFADIFTSLFVNAQLIQDYFARNGKYLFNVYVISLIATVWTRFYCAWSRVFRRISICRAYEGPRLGPRKIHRKDRRSSERNIAWMA